MPVVVVREQADEATSHAGQAPGAFRRQGGRHRCAGAGILSLLLAMSGRP